MSDEVLVVCRLSNSGLRERKATFLKQFRSAQIRSNFFPCRQPQAGDIRRSCLHTLAMLLRVRTNQLNFGSACTRSMRNADPGIPRQMNRIDGIRNHSSTESEVVLGDRVGDEIPSVVEWLAQRSGIADCLLNRVHAHMYCTELSSQLSSNRCLANTW